MLPERLLSFSTPIPVLGGQGHVVLLDVMGDDAAVADAARTSYQGDAALREARDEQKDAALIRRLMRDRHTSPFEHAVAKFHMRLPMDVHRQHVRHRTASLSEYSTRYKPAIDAALTTAPEAWRRQAKDNKQGSSGRVEEWPEGWVVRRSLYAEDADCWEVSAPGISDGVLNGMISDGVVSLGDIDPQQGSTVMATLVSPNEPPTPGDYLTAREQQAQALTREVYEERFAFGVAREQARKDLPLSTMTEIVWTMDLHNLLHYLTLRLDPHAQQEIREYAEVFRQIVEVWCPATYAAFVDWRLEAVTFSGPEIRALRAWLSLNVWPEHASDVSLGLGNCSFSEQQDFLRKLGLEEK